MHIYYYLIKNNLLMSEMDKNQRVNDNVAGDKNGPKKGLWKSNKCIAYLLLFTLLLNDNIIRQYIQPYFYFFISCNSIFKRHNKIC